MRKVNLKGCERQNSVQIHRFFYRVIVTQPNGVQKQQHPYKVQNPLPWWARRKQILMRSPISDPSNNTPHTHPHLPRNQSLAVTRRSFPDKPQHISRLLLTRSSDVHLHALPHVDCAQFALRSLHQPFVSTINSPNSIHLEASKRTCPNGLRREVAG